MPLSHDNEADCLKARRAVSSFLSAAGKQSLSFITVLNLPEEVWASVQERLGSAPNPASRAIALLTALDWLSVGKPSQALGTGLALEAFWASYGRDKPPGSPEYNLVRRNTPLVLHSIVFALLALGALDELIDLSEKQIPELRQNGMPMSAMTLVVMSAEAQLRLGRVAVARTLLPERETITGAAAEQNAGGAPIPHGPTLVRRDNLALELSHLETAAVAETPLFKHRKATVLTETIEAVRSLMERKGIPSEDVERAIAKLEALGDRPGRGQDADMIQATRLLALLDEILGPFAPGVDLRAARLHKVTDALTTGEHGVCEEALEELQRLKQGERAAGDINGWLVWAWNEARILMRLERWEAALDILENIRDERDKLSEGAASAQERAGLGSSFMNLAPRLASIRWRLGKESGSVFDAIENGKGRWLSDSIRGSSQDLTTFHEQTAAARIHYLSFAVDEEESIAVFLPYGGPPMVAEVPVGRTAIARTAFRMTHEGTFRATLANELAESIGRLTSWLPAPSPDGIVRRGDVLLVAPHGALHTTSRDAGR